MEDRKGTPALLIVANLINLLAVLIAAPLMARALGPAGRGEASAVIAALNLLPILLAIGLPLVVRRSAAEGRRSEAQRSAIVLGALAFIPAAVVSLGLVSTIFAGLDNQSRLAAFIGLASAPITILWMSAAAGMVGVENYRAVAVVRICQPVAFAMYLVGAVILSAVTVSGVIWAQTISNALTLVIALILARTRMRGARLPLIGMVRQSIKLSGGSIAEALSYRLDQVIILPLAGGVQAGLYSIASVVGSLPLAVAQALAAPFFREVASEKRERHRVTATGMREVASASAVCALALAISAPLFVPWVFGESFRGAIVPTLIYLIGSYGLACATYCSLILVARAHGLIMSMGQIAALILNMCLLIVLAPLLGAIGAAIASTLAYASLAVYFTKRIGLTTAALIPRPRSFVNAVRRTLGKGV